MTSNRIYRVMKLAVAWVGAVILISTGSISGNATLKQSISDASAPAPLYHEDDQWTGTAPKPPTRQERNQHFVNLVLDPGDTLLSVFSDAGISEGDAFSASEKLGAELDLRGLKSGQMIRVGFRTTGKGTEKYRLESIALTSETDRLVVVERSIDGRFESKSLLLEHTVDLISVSGQIATSLHNSLRDKGVPMAVLLQTFGMLGHAIDFQRDIRTGDSFALGYESFDDGEFGGKHSGKLVYVSLTRPDGTLSYVRYKTSDGFTGYFDAKGYSVETSLIKTPVDGGRLSSLFGKREHPVLGYTRMHKGLDFAAPRGTPVLAAGDGVITTRARNGTFGRYLRIQHQNEYSTTYAHLSKYKKSIKPGRRVRQGDVIGYVGATGLTSGPNLHYEVLWGGRQMNPLAVELPSQRVLIGEELSRFRRAASKLLSGLEFNALGKEAGTIPILMREVGVDNG